MPIQIYAPGEVHRNNQIQNKLLQGRTQCKPPTKKQCIEFLASLEKAIAKDAAREARDAKLPIILRRLLNSLRNI